MATASPGRRACWRTVLRQAATKTPLPSRPPTCGWCGRRRNPDGVRARGLRWVQRGPRHVNCEPGLRLEPLQPAPSPVVTTPSTALVPASVTSHVPDGVCTTENGARSPFAHAVCQGTPLAAAYSRGLTRARCTLQKGRTFTDKRRNCSQPRPMDERVRDRHAVVNEPRRTRHLTRPLASQRLESTRSPSSGRTDLPHTRDRLHG